MVSKAVPDAKTDVRIVYKVSVEAKWFVECGVKFDAQFPSCRRLACWLFRLDENASRVDSPIGPLANQSIQSYLPLSLRLDPSLQPVGFL